MHFCIFQVPSKILLPSHLHLNEWGALKYINRAPMPEVVVFSKTKEALFQRLMLFLKLGSDVPFLHGYFDNHNHTILYFQQFVYDFVKKILIYINIL